MRRLLFALLIGVATAVAPAQEGPITDSYRIGPKDQIQIRVDEIANLDQELEVAEDGNITLPGVGTVEAQGLTADQLALRIRSQLEARGLRKATVAVSVTAYRSRPVWILGAVGSPGNHYVARQASLMEILMKAGGLTAKAGTEIIVRRRADNGLSDEVRIAVSELIEAGNPRVDIPIFAGDLIRVAPAREIKIHFLGAVGNAGTQTYRSTERVTLLTAIVRAGGLTEVASNKIRIKRRTQSGEWQEVTVNFKRILNSTDPDIELQDGDILVVKESFF